MLQQIAMQVRCRKRIPLTPGALLLATSGLAAADWGTQLAGGFVFPGGLLDEIAHLLTPLLVLWALGPRVSKRYTTPTLLASVAIDFDHVPDRLGFRWLTAGTPRPYTHSLTTIVVVLMGAALWRRQRDVLLGVALGLAIHFWRDLSEPHSGVALLWPASYYSFRLPHGSYAVAMAAVVAINAWRCRSQRTIVMRGRSLGRPANDG